MSQTGGGANECGDLKRRGRLMKLAHLQILSLLLELLQEVPATTHQIVWFLHNGAPAYFSVALRDHIDAAISGGELNAVDMLHGLHASRISIPWFSFFGST
ncbi:hypothetical protein TNCV_4937961 [Trichonephila clavipes]|nr:hypothetical protein TNCV_4937961 [Trichonephila clavipes]